MVYAHCKLLLLLHPYLKPDLPHTHFFHVRSSRTDAKPLLLCHGWPQTSLEFLDIIPLLTEPSNASDQAFHVVVPSLPGFLWSSPPAKEGVGVDVVAKGWDQLMGLLGYNTYLVHGGDWGSFVARRIGQVASSRVAGVHLTLPIFPPPKPLSNPIAFTRLVLSQLLPKSWIYSELESDELAKLITFVQHNSAYLEIQKTKPQTLGHSLSDSPVGLLAWHLCIFHNWSHVADGQDMPKYISPKAILKEITATWFTNSGATSARMYWEGFGLQNGSEAEVWKILGIKSNVPHGIAWFLHEPSKSPREWAECYADIVSWSVFKEGGHFGGMERPEDLVGDIRKLAGVGKVKARLGGKSKM